MAVNRTYFVNNSANTAVAYDFDGTRQSADDISLGTAAWEGVVASNNRLYFIQSGGTVHAYDFDGNRQSADDISLGSGAWRGGAASDDRLYFIDDNANTAVAYDFDGTRQSADDISLSNHLWEGGIASDDRLYFINRSRSRAVAYDFDGNPQSSDDIGLSRVDWRGGAASNNRLYFIQSGGTVHAYDFDGNRQSADDISLGRGGWQGGAATIQLTATLTISTDDTDIRPNEQVNINIVSDIDISDFAATDITVRGGTRGTLTRTDARNYVLSVTAASSAGTMTVSIAQNVVSPGNAAVSQNFTINPNPVVKSDLVVSITGTTSIVQGQRTTLTAVVTDADDETLTSGLTYAWTASRGRFIGATDEASAVYEANFTDSSNVAVTITCAVTRPADTAPTSSGASLTALADIGVTGILVNMFMTALGTIASNSNNALYQAGSVGTLASGSDQALSSDITIWRIRWNNDSNRIILNNNASGSLQTYFTANTDKSLYVIFEDGTYVELPQANLVSTGTTWAQWSVTDANIVAKLNALTTTSDLLIGIAEAGSIGIEANSGSGTATVTATPRPLPAPSVPASLSAAAIDHDSIRLTFSASTGTVTQYQYKIATSQVGLASATWNNGGTGTTIDVHGLTPSTQYYFQVRACNQTVYSAASNTANATTQAPPLVAPSVPGSLSAAAIDHDTIRLTFSASTGTVTQYQYKVATSSAGLAGASWNNGGTATTINVDGLTPSTQYYFQVRALNQTVGSAASNTANAMTQAAPLVAPSTPGSFAVAVLDHDTIQLTFTASTGTVTQYQYKVATSSAGLASAVWTDGGTGTTITVDGLSPSTQYYFQVRACNQTVYSAATSALTGTTQALPPPTAPDAPSNFAGTVAFRSATLMWDAEAGKTYEVRRDDGAFEDATSPHQVVGLMRGTEYLFGVRVKASGATPAGNIASVTLTTGALPAVPTGPITLITPASTNTDTIVARLTSDVNLAGIGDEDFSLHRSDTDAEISATISEQKQGDYFWDITVQQADDYGGQAYLRISADAFLTVQTLQRVPSSTLYSNEFEFIIPPSAAPSGFTASNGIYSTTLRWNAISDFTYEYRIQGGPWTDAVPPQLVTGLTADTDYNFDLRVKADGDAPAGLIATVYLRTLLFPIESIDEQFIPIGTEDYELAIGLIGQNLEVDVEGLQEGFYQTFQTLDDGNSQIIVKADEVTRLLEKAVWRVNYHDLDNDVRADAQILYNVIPVTPVFVDPGRQTIYKGVPFELLVEVLNEPTVQRGDCELVGLKFDAVTVEERAYIKSAGILPADTILTFEEFDADYYIENGGGSDTLQVPFDIRDDAVTPVISGLTGGTWTGDVSERFQVTAVPDPVVRLSADSPDWLMVSRVGETTTYEITGAAPGEGTYTATVLAIGFGTVQQQISIVIRNYVPPVQPPAPTVPRPVIAGISNVSRTLGYSAFTIQASLSAGSGVTWGVSGIPGATITSGGQIAIPAGLSVGTYTGTVTASNSGGSDTETFSVSVQTSTVSPSGMITLQAVAGNGQVDLSWNHPTVRGIPYTGYDVVRSTRSDFQTISVVANALLATTFSDTNVSNGTTYYYKVRLDSYALDLESNADSATPNAAPAVVRPVINAISNVSRTSGYSQFTIQASLSSGTSPTWSISGIAGATISDTGLITIPAGLSIATHTATVTARNSAGSDTETFSVAVAATAPSGTITLTAAYQTLTRSVDLSWNAPSNLGDPAITSYEIVRVRFSGQLEATYTVSATSTTLSDANNLDAGHFYDYTVVARNSAGEVRSNTVRVMIPN